MGTIIPAAPAAPTVGEIARRLGRPIHRVEYVIRSRDIRPINRAGNARVFTDADVQLIAGELERIDQDRGVGREAVGS